MSNPDRGKYVGCWKSQVKSLAHHSSFLINATLDDKD